MTARSFALALVLPVTAGLSHAAQTVLFNESAAFECYQAARHGGDEYDIDTCTLALEHQALAPRDRAATFSNRGILHARTGSIQEALADHDRAVRLAPDIASVYINRSNTLIRAKRFDGAMADLEKAIELADENLAAAHYNRALLFQRLGDSKAARADAERAAEIAPQTEAYRRFLQELEVKDQPAGRGVAPGF